MPRLNKSRRRQSRRRLSRRRQVGGAATWVERENRYNQESRLPPMEKEMIKKAKQEAWNKWQQKMATLDNNRKSRVRGEPCSSMLGWDNFKDGLTCEKRYIDAPSEVDTTNGIMSFRYNPRCIEKEHEPYSRGLDPRNFTYR